MTEPEMKDDRYLLLGLNALSRAHTTNYFADGHRGGAIISGVYLCRENDVEHDVPDLVTGIIDEQWSLSSLCAPFPQQPTHPQLLDRIVDCLSDHVTGLREVGHNVILPALALKAFRDVPEAITETRVDGVCQLIRSFTAKAVPMDDDFHLPDMSVPGVAADFILSEFVQCAARFIGRGQGWTGHLLTYGRALMDLYSLGYMDLAKEAEAGFRIYVRRIRKGPQDTDGVYEEHVPTGFSPLQADYWLERGGDVHLGHKLKYPYGFYGLLQFVNDPQIEQESLASAFRVL
jgi:hypothetical protein